MPAKVTADASDITRLDGVVQELRKDLEIFGSAHQGLSTLVQQTSQDLSTVSQNLEKKISENDGALQALKAEFEQANQKHVEELAHAEKVISWQHERLESLAKGLPLPLPGEKIDALRMPLPIEAIGKNERNPELSAIKPIFVIERLNEVFGLAGWSFTTEIVESNTKHIVVKVTVRIPEFGIVREAFGGNDMEDRGDAYKGAVSDALNKIGGFLYIGMDVFKGHGPTISNNGHRTPARTEAQTTVATGQESVKTGETGFVCADCRKNIAPMKAADGETYSATQQVQVSRTRKEWLSDPNKADSGPDLCGFCQRKRRAKSQAEKAAPAPIR